MDDKMLVQLTVGDIRNIVEEACRKVIAGHVSAPSPKYLTRKQAAARYGVVPATISNWAVKGAPIMQLGGGPVRVDAKAMDMWVRREVPKLKAV